MEFILNVQKPMLSVFLDLSKAFDTLDHNVLLTKMAVYDIRGKAYNWFKDYLFNRTQFVKYKNSTSDTLNFSVVFHKDLSLVLCYLSYILMIYHSV